jgi:Fe-S oxidoreductase
MCLSWIAPHDEEHSTRGRARLLFELLRDDSHLDGWQDEAVGDALDLCLSCKACKAECPVDVDMATYKAEFLAHRYDGRIRPLGHYALGLAHRWLRLGASLPRTTSTLLASPVGRLGRRLAGVTTERSAPAMAPEPFSRWWRRRPTRTSPAPAGRVLLFVDTFTETLTPEVGRAAVTVLEAAGHHVEVAPRPVCCGRPLYDHGMLDTARRQLRRLARTLAPLARSGVPIVGLEPSCVAALRDELPGLLPDDADARAVTTATRTLAEQLDAVGWQPPRLEGEVVAHPHCHQRAVWGSEAERRLLAAAGAGWHDLDAGCCGLAGSFGWRDGEPYEVSVAVGEDRFAPRVREATAAGATVVADGYSCRAQAAHLAPEADGVRHLAVVLAEALTRRDR